jgi:hypothetical protein
LAERFIPRRERQRMALGISADEMAAELRITTEQLVVVEAQTSLPRLEDVGRAWDLALGRIVKAREDAAHDEAAAASEGPTDTSDALRQWAEGTERAHSAPTVATVPPAKAGRASQPRKATGSRRRRK